MFHSLGHHRAYGVSLLVGCCLFLLSAHAAFDGNDKDNLYHIYEHVNSLDIFSMWYQDWIEDRQYAIDTSLSDIHNIGRFLYGYSPSSYGETLFSIENDSRDALEDIRGILEPFTNSVVSSTSPFDSRRTAQIAVTNVAETAKLNEILGWMTRISTNVENSYYVPFDPNIYFGGYTSSQYPPETQLNLYYSKMASYYTAQHNRDFSTAQTLYKEILRQFGSWKWQAMQTYLILNPQLLLGSRIATNGMVRTLNTMMDMNNVADAALMRVYRDSYYDQYSTRSLRDHLSRYFNSTGISSDNFNPTNFFSADGSIAKADNVFTNSGTSVFNKFATSFLPSSLFNPDQVNTSLFSYVDSGINENPTFNPPPLRGGTRSSSRADASFNYDFDDSDQYDYNLVNPLKTATDVVQGDTDIDDKFNILADLVNQRISSIFDSPLNSISQQPSRWSVKFRGKDGSTIEEYVASQQAETTDGISFACWVLESTMFLGFFFVCVRRSLRIGNSLDPQS